MWKEMILIAFFVSIAGAYTVSTIPFQALGIANNGNVLNNGNLTFYFYSSLGDCQANTSALFQDTFNWTGHPYVALGSQNALNLTLNSVYWYNYSINGQNTNDSLCRSFYATIGNVLNGNGSSGNGTNFFNYNAANNTIYNQTANLAIGANDTNGSAVLFVPRTVTNISAYSGSDSSSIDQLIQYAAGDGTYSNCGQTTDVRVLAYQNSPLGKVYSNYTQLIAPQVADGDGAGCDESIQYVINWTAIPGADGYYLVRYDPDMLGANWDYDYDAGNVTSVVDGDSSFFWNQYTGLGNYDVSFFPNSITISSTQFPTLNVVGTTETDYLEVRQYVNGSLNVSGSLNATNVTAQNVTVTDTFSTNSLALPGGSAGSPPLRIGNTSMYENANGSLTLQNKTGNAASFFAGRGTFGTTISGSTFTVFGGATFASQSFEAGNAQPPGAVYISSCLGIGQSCTNVSGLAMTSSQTAASNKTYSALKVGATFTNGVTDRPVALLNGIQVTMTPTVQTIDLVPISASVQINAGNVNTSSSIIAFPPTAGGTGSRNRSILMTIVPDTNLNSTNLCIASGSETTPAPNSIVRATGCPLPGKSWDIYDNSRLDSFTNSNWTFNSTTNMSNHIIGNVSDPINPQDAATKAYVDLVGHFGGFVKQSDGFTRTFTSSDNYTAIGNMTFNHISIGSGNFTTGVFKVNLTGEYAMQYSASFSGSANNNIGFAIAVNGVKQNNTYSQNKLGSNGGDMVNIGGVGIVSIANGDNVTLVAANEGATNQIQVVVANMIAEKVSN